MKLFPSCRGFRLLLFAGLVCILLAPLTTGADDKKKPAQAPPPAKPAAPPHPGGTGGVPGHQPSPGGAANRGPSANGRTSGPTTNNPGARPGSTQPLTTSSGHAGNANVSSPHNRTGNGGAIASGRTATGGLAPAGSHTISTSTGSAITRRPDGKISDVHDTHRGMDIHHNLNGAKRVSVERPDHTRIVVERGRPGFIERRYEFHGHEYARRSYYWHGREYPRYYRPYYYRGVYVNVYAPAYYYAPAFYGWAYNPWAVPVTYGWGWAGNPWYGYYGYYFAPYPVYAGPAFWLTDYIIATELQAAFEARAEDAAAEAPSDGGAPALTPEVKQLITDEVKAQIALENAEAQQNSQGQEADPSSSGIARILSDGQPHVFVAGSALDVVDANGQECALSDGDALQLTGPPPADATSAQLVVLASKGSGECARSTSVTVAVADLQEMQNHMRETIDQGLQELQSKQGQGGIPTAPPSTKAPPAQTSFAQSAPAAEQDGEHTVNQQLAEADQAEQQTAQEAQQNGAGSSSTAQGSASGIPPQGDPPTLSIGQTINQVTSAFGRPLAVIDLGAKKIYKYDRMKVTFQDGKVSDVETK